MTTVAKFVAQHLKPVRALKLTINTQSRKVVAMSLKTFGLFALSAIEERVLMRSNPTLKRDCAKARSPLAPLR